MKILWFPRLQLDIDKLHITTWREICKSLEEAGQQIVIAIAGEDINGVWGRPYVKIPIIPIKFIRLATFWISGFVKFISSYLRERPDAIILDLFSLWMSAPLLVIPHKKRPVLIVDNRTPFYNERGKSFAFKDYIMWVYTWLAFKYASIFLDGMTVITDFYKRYVCKKYDFKEDTIGVWNSGVNIKHFDAGIQAVKNAEFNNQFVLMQHGEISYNRGLFETVEALSLLSENISLELIGDSIKSNAKNDLRELAERLRVSRRLIIKPRIPYNRIPEYIIQADCAIMAYPNIEYWNNNNPIKLLEYLALGKVVICTNMWTFRDVMKDSNCACYIQDNKPATIAEAIKYCVENKEKLAGWGEKGIEIVKNRFTWEKQAERLLIFIQSLGDRRFKGKAREWVN